MIETSLTDTELDAAVGLSTASYTRLAHFITAELGIKMPESKLPMVQSRLMKRVRELCLASVDEYTEYFFHSANSAEREQFINLITTNKTDFFREPEHFRHLQNVLLPGFMSGHPALYRKMKVWSAGCSSGEEPYTLSMVLSEFAALHPGFDYAILATDISTKVLACARRGIYQAPQVEPVPHALRAKYLWHSRNSQQPLVRIAPQLREKISFHQLNFMDEQYSLKDTFDLVFFRNVMIYFDRPTQELVINKICRHLAPGGHFFTGHSESLAGMDVPLKPVDVAIYRKSG